MADASAITAAVEPNNSIDTSAHISAAAPPADTTIPAAAPPTTPTSRMPPPPADSAGTPILSTSAPLPSGSTADYGNEEGADVSPPLPPEWSSVASLPVVSVYSEMISPPSCKVRALLAFYGVAFVPAGKHRPGSPYTKKPHITIGTGTGLRQINDSVIIFRTLGAVVFSALRSLAVQRLHHSLLFCLLLLSQPAFLVASSRLQLLFFWMRGSAPRSCLRCESRGASIRRRLSLWRIWAWTVREQHHRVSDENLKPPPHPFPPLLCLSCQTPTRTAA
jgi:hypothetical protein